MKNKYHLLSHDQLQRTVLDCEVPLDKISTTAMINSMRFAKELGLTATLSALAEKDTPKS